MNEAMKRRAERLLALARSCGGCAARRKAISGAVARLLPKKKGPRK